MVNKKTLDPKNTIKCNGKTKILTEKGEKVTDDYQDVEIEKKKNAIEKLDRTTK